MVNIFTSLLRGLEKSKTDEFFNPGRGKPGQLVQVVLRMVLNSPELSKSNHGGGSLDDGVAVGGKNLTSGGEMGN